MSYVFKPLLHTFIAATALAVAGCASGPPAPVVDLTTGAATEHVAATDAASTALAQAPDTYRVVAGDTLYSIAFRHGLDYRDLARWNAIDTSWHIGVGQLLHLGPVAAQQNAQPVPGTAVTEAAPDRSVAAKVTSLTMTPAPSSGAQTSSPATHKPVLNPAAPTSALRPTAPEIPVVQTPRVAPVVASGPTEVPVAVPAQLNAGGVTWRWPSDGKVIGTFVDGDQTRQGVDIAGKSGDPVRAAAAGEVVYSGNGLIGYGELIIVKHNTNYLSAYAHNRKRLVKEGQNVAAGQQIAEMGATASSRDELHFEIRKNGKPVNPLDFLPAR